MKKYLLLLLSISILVACKSKKHKKVGDPVTAEEVKEVYLDSTEQSCRGAVLRLLLSSSKVKLLLLAVDETVKKNGGSGHGFILDSSPNPDTDGAEKETPTYEFSVHEIFPQMHPPVAQFVYDPAKKELYQFDALTNKNTLIDMDSNLLGAIKNACK